jgi:SAM-dependent methyltransferase
MRPNLSAVMTASEYYNERHSRGWMETWPIERRKRVVDAILSNGLRPGDRVLEFGCGPGVYAHALHLAMPELEVHGCDISEVGVEAGRAERPGVTFHHLSSEAADPPLGTYDLVYSHHVLEHVEDLDAALCRISSLVRPGGMSIHIIPCGNRGSLEWRIAQLVRDGVMPDQGGLFWSDDISHVRRLTSAQLADGFRRCGLALERARFANQFWGGIEYFCDVYHWTVFDWLNPAKGKSFMAKVSLALLLGFFGTAGLFRKMPAHVLKTIGQRRPAALRALFWAAVPLALVAWPFASAFDWVLRRLRDLEWEHGSESPNGSEAVLFFRKK